MRSGAAGGGDDAGLAAGTLARLWRGDAPFLSACLIPAELLFRLGQSTYHHAHDAGLLPRATATLPTISVGNLAVGGSGKTPVSRWLLDILLERGERPALLHGGYAEDEPVLHGLWHPDVPVFSGRDRAANAALAADRGATVVVLDDGFQHRRLRRDLDIVLVSAERWSRHPRLLPRGPWREPPAALRRADIVAVTRKTASADQAGQVAVELNETAPRAANMVFAIVPKGWRRWGSAAQPEAVTARRQPDFAAGASLAESAGPAADARVTQATVVVCAIADPDLFLVNAREAGAHPERTFVFRDHHTFTVDELAEIREAAGPAATVLTTEKDAVKLAVAAPDLQLWVLEQQVHVEKGQVALDAALDDLLQRRSSRAGAAP